MENIIIEERQTHAMKIAFIGLLLLLTAIFIWVIGMKEKKMMYCGIGCITTIVFSINFLVLFGRAMQKRSLLTITFDGIIDSSSATSVGFIAYQDIEEFCIFNLNGQQVIGIMPKDETAFIDKLSPMKQEIAKVNIDMKYPPFTIQVKRAKDMSLEDIFSLLKKRLDDYSCLYD